AGYLGAVASGLVVGGLAQHQGGGVAFRLLAIVTGLSAVACIGCWWERRTSDHRAEADARHAHARWSRCVPTERPARNRHADARSPTRPSVRVLRAARDNAVTLAACITGTGALMRYTPTLSTVAGLIAGLVAAHGLMRSSHADEADRTEVVRQAV